MPEVSALGGLKGRGSSDRPTCHMLRDALPHPRAAGTGTPVPTALQFSDGRQRAQKRRRLQLRRCRPVGPDPRQGSEPKPQVRCARAVGCGSASGKKAVRPRGSVDGPETISPSAEVGEGQRRLGLAYTWNLKNRQNETNAADSQTQRTD